MSDVDGLNAGYAKALLEEYLENPAGVPAEWRRLFESGEPFVEVRMRLLKLVGGHWMPPSRPSHRARGYYSKQPCPAIERACGTS